MQKWEIILGLCLCTSLLHAKTVTVSLDGTQDFTNIRQAVEQSESGDTIILHPGTYRGVENCGIDISARHLQSLRPTDPNCVKNTVVDCEVVYQSSSSNRDRNAFYMSKAGLETITGITFKNHSSNWGSVICDDTYMNILAVRHCRFINNQAPLGAVIMAANSFHWTISNCEFINNNGNVGSVITAGHYCFRLEINNCLFVGNVVSDRGLISVRGDRTSIQNCTFVGNTASKQPALINDSLYPPFPLEISHSIFQDNRVSSFKPKYSGNPGGARNLGETTITYEYSENTSLDALFAKSTVLSYCCLPKELAQDPNLADFSDTGNIFQDPLLVHNANDGGDGWMDNPGTPDLDESTNNAMGDWHLKSDSPCIDAGSADTPSGAYSFDLDFELRRTGRTIDIGCDEYQIPTIIMDSPKDHETWISDTNHLVQWHSLANTHPVNIELSINPDHDWQTIEKALPPSGSCVIALPQNIDSETCQFRAIAELPEDMQVVVPSVLFSIHPQGAESPSINQPIWPTLAGNFQRTGLSQFAGPDPNIALHAVPIPPFSPVPKNIPTRINMVAGPANAVLIYTENVLTAFQLDMDANTPDYGVMPLWQYETHATISTTPTLSSRGNIYVGDEAGVLYALNSSGNLLWTFSTQSPISSSPAINDTGQVFFGSSNGCVYALDTQGSLLWKFPTSNRQQDPTSVIMSPALTHEGLIIIGALHDPNLYALDPDQGTPAWTYTLQPEVWPGSTPVVSDNGQVYQVFTNGELHAINTLTGATCWSLDLWMLAETPETNAHPPTVYSSPVLDPNGTLYITLGESEIYAVSPEGISKWITTVDIIKDPTMTADTTGHLYVTGYPKWIPFPETWLDHQWNLSRIDSTGNVIPLWPDPNYQYAAYKNFGRPVILADQTIAFVGQARFETYEYNSVNTLFIAAPPRNTNTAKDQDNEANPKDPIPSTPR